MGSDILKRLGIAKPRSERGFAQFAGIDLEKEIELTSEAWILDGIKFPRVVREHQSWDCDFSNIVLSSYFRRKSESYDHYCDVVENHLGDFGEGPYEYGNVCLKEGDVVFDCGANMGLFSAVASRYGANVFAFEAVPEIIYGYLSKTADMNGNIRI